MSHLLGYIIVENIDTEALPKMLKDHDAFALWLKYLKLYITPDL